MIQFQQCYPSAKLQSYFAKDRHETGSCSNLELHNFDASIFFFFLFFYHRLVISSILIAQRCSYVFLPFELNSLVQQFNSVRFSTYTTLLSFNTYFILSICKKECLQPKSINNHFFLFWPLSNLTVTNQTLVAEDSKVLSVLSTFCAEPK